MSFVECTHRDATTVLCLNKPEQLNTLCLTLAQEFADTVEHLAQKPPKAIILTGKGRAFSSGGDLAWLQEKQSLSKQENERAMLVFYHSFLSLRSLPCLLIAAVNGLAYGAGLGLALACDIRLAADTASFCANFCRLGLHPGMGVSTLLPSVIGKERALWMLATATAIDAKTAKDFGLVLDVFVHEKLLDAAFELVDSSFFSKALGKTLMTVRTPLKDALKQEASHQASDFQSADFREGLAAVFEKRNPNFHD